MKTSREIENSIHKKFRKRLWTPFIKALKDFELIEDGDRLALAISGGKDSFIMAKLFQQLYRHGKRNFELVFIAMDPGYNEENRRHLEELAQHMEIPLRIYNRDIFSASQRLATSPCYMCARMRRGALYELAQEEGCNKLVLGHHFDDVIETVLLNVLRGGTFMTMMPKLPSQNFQGMELIRPLYYVKEKDIIAWRDYNNLKFLDCACPLSSSQEDSSRQKIKELLPRIKEDFPQVESSILAATKHVHLNAILGTVYMGEETSFLDNYDKERNFNE